MMISLSLIVSLPGLCAMRLGGKTPPKATLSMPVTFGAENSY